MAAPKKKQYSNSYSESAPKGKHSLIILEGTGKFTELKKFQSKIEEKVGNAVSFIDTGGHFLTTDGNSLGINVDIDKKVFYPEYIVSTSELSKNKVSALRTRIKACLDSGGKILLMTDNDRAGDHIAWEVIEHFKLKDGDWLRSGITTPKEKDFMKALDALKPELHIGRLESERARMVLDKCFGYIQSPHLWNKIKKVEAKHIEALRDGTQQMLEEFKEENKAVMHEARVKDFVSFVEGIIEEVGTFAGDKSEIIKSSIGRVQIPMLRLVMDTFLESFGKIKVVNNIRVTDGNGFNWKFAPTTESAESLEDGVTEGDDEVGISTDVDIDAVYKSLNGAKEITIKGLSVRKRSTKPPKPYNELTFVGEGGAILKLSSEKLGETAQKLYEAALTTYYRSKFEGYTDSSHDDVAKLVTNAGLRLEKRKYPIDPNASHDAIHTAYDGKITLGKDGRYAPEKWATSSAPEEHRAVFDLIHRHTLATMMPDFQSDEISLIGDINGYRFELSINDVTDMGFAEAMNWYLGSVRNMVKHEMVQEYSEGKNIPVTDIKLEKGKFRFTSDTNEDAFRKKLEKRRIGTPATSTPILDEISSQKKQYIKYFKDERKLRITAKGWMLYNLMRKYEAFNLELTDELEDGFEKLENGKIKYKDFLSEAFNKFFIDGGYWEFYQDFLKHGSGAGNKVEDTDIKCPKCGAPVVKKTVYSSKHSKNFIILECTKKKYNPTTKKSSGCEYMKYLNE